MYTITCRPWENISQQIKKLNPKLFEAMNTASHTLPNKYVYEVNLPLGLDLLNQGEPIYFSKTFLDNCTFESVYNKQITSNQFVSDFFNKNDHPLCLIKEGVIEVYEMNAYQLLLKEFSYPFPLNIIETGQMLGTFGATDMIHESITPLYVYSAISGKCCLFPILPRTFETGQLIYKNEIRKICKDYNIPYKQDEQIFTFFPKLIKKFYQMHDSHISLILIPDFWFIGKKIEAKIPLRGLISQIAWIQSKDARMSELSLVPIIRNMRSKDPLSHVYAEMVAYLLGILDGKRFAMKPINKESVNYELLAFMQERLQKCYGIMILEFDFLKKGNWGIFPLFNFPTLKPNPGIPIADKFLRDLNSRIEDDARVAKLVEGKLQFYYDPKIFYTENFPESNYFGQNFLTKSVLKINSSI